MYLIPFKPCSLCKDSSSQPGFLKIEDQGSILLKECECHKKWYENSKRLMSAYRSNFIISKDSLEYDLIKSHKGSKDLKKLEILNKYVIEFSEGGNKELCIYLLGNSNTQKTTIAQWIGLTLIRNGFTCYYESMHNFITRLVPTDFNDPERFKIYHDKLLSCDLLIIDDAFDRWKSNISSFQLPYMEAFFRERIERHQKGILWVSCVSPYDIKKYLSSESLQNFVVKILTKSKGLVKLVDSMEHIDVSTIFDPIGGDA